MAIFLDTGFFTGFYHPKDSHHLESVQIFRALSQGEYGLIYTSPYIISETATLLLIRTNHNQNLLADFFSDLYGTTKFVSILPWSSEIEQKTRAFFRKHNKSVKTKEKLMSFTDASNVIYCRDYQIEEIATYDSHFDGILTRVLSES